MLMASNRDDPCNLCYLMMLYPSMGEFLASRGVLMQFPYYDFDPSTCKLHASVLLLSTVQSMGFIALILDHHTLMASGHIKKMDTVYLYHPVLIMRRSRARNPMRWSAELK